MENVRHMNPRTEADRDSHAQDPIDRRVPHDIEAEQIVLAGCMAHGHLIPECATLIDGADFYRHQHEIIWQALHTLAINGDPTDLPAVRLELERTQQLDRAGGNTYLHTIYSWALPNPDYYAEEVAKLARKRRHDQHATRIKAEIARGADIDDLDRLQADFVEEQAKRATGANLSRVDQLLAEMLDSNGLENMPALEPLVGDLLHLDSLARVIGPSGHMKSFMTIDVAGHVGTGLPWHGMPVHQGTVIYLVAEGARGIRKRVRAWEQHYGTRMSNVLFLPRPVQAMDPEWLTLIEACKRLGPVLIVIDTQARVSVGVEENSAKELGLVIDRMEQLRAGTGACVLVIHHTGHIGDHGRGSSSAKGALQSELHVSKKGDNASNAVITVKTGKQKDDEQGADLQFGLKVVRIRGDAKPDGSPVTSVVLVSHDQLDRGPVPGTPEFIVATLDKAGVPLSWGVPRVSKELAAMGVQARKDKIEEAVRRRKNRNSFEDPQDASENLPPDLPPSTFNQTPPDFGGSTGEVTQNRRSNIPPQPGGGPGDAPSKPPSPRPPSREGGGEGEPTKTAPTDRPLCTTCSTPMDPTWHARGYDTHVLCPAKNPTPSEPDKATA